MLHHTNLSSKTQQDAADWAQIFFFATLHQISLSSNRTGWSKLGTNEVFSSLFCITCLSSKKYSKQLAQQKLDSTKHFISLLKGP